VALDQACLDLIWAAEGNESFIQRVTELEGLHTLEHAVEVGLGTRNYNLININEAPAAETETVPAEEAPKA
jgi:uncharacterized Fe-S center protein